MPSLPDRIRDGLRCFGVGIASNATVLGPCTIGDDAVVAAGSVATGQLESGWVYAGVPARPVRRVNAQDKLQAST